MFQIDLAPSGELILHMPNGGHVEIYATPSGLDYIKKILTDHHKGIRNQPGYIGTMPTQHAVNKFLRDKEKRIKKEKADELKAKANKLDIDWNRLEITL